MCVTKLGGSSETVAAKVLDRKCVKNEHEHSSQFCIRAQPRFDYGSTKPVAGNLSLPSPVHDNVSSRYERDSHPVWSRPGSQLRISKSISFKKKFDIYNNEKEPFYCRIIDELKVQFDRFIDIKNNIWQK